MFAQLINVCRLMVAEFELKTRQYEHVKHDLEDTERSIKQYKQKKAMFRAQGQMRQLIEAQRSQQAQIKANETLERTRKDKERMMEHRSNADKMKLTNDAIKRLTLL